tara:strand:- start:98 stop:349 length:252 start_codon:yes stop_codon:yes gene_type:complete
MRTIFIILAFPLTLFGLDNNFGHLCDAAVNALLEITSNYLVHKNDVNLSENIDFKIKKDCIDWTDIQFLKWQIIEPKNPLMNE